MNNGKILVVDDDVKIVKIVKHCLEKEGFTVVTAGDGEAAVALVKADCPDLIILDLMLPKLDGLEVCRIITQTCDVPIIILSAKGDELDRIVGFRMGVDDYLTKPFSPTELVLRVQAVIRRTRGQQKKRVPQRIKCGVLEIDPATREVTVGRQRVGLTGKEFDLLYFLACNPQQVFSRMQLLNNIWHSDYEGDENTVTVHIRRLREKIEPIPSEPVYIKTVWGVGYKFDGVSDKT